ncbi:pentatricopeptide repeat-containing protein At1g31790 [Cynara cardunculus var. scolymus]|uniref:Pentatricopeptide repeat-containing protein n=1 Tax=Cynara cardunculus var. scolymus TaxID=59895 RepID=A0A103XIM4_CYNCS|nr:pentatricopeptide repeat-containing protein At1g31790 [Cynara cardunculus var. scolymus]KVH91328.1 Pentatricopeptide repeat-containing protein [Cynara cardunculus var. scolymus]
MEIISKLCNFNFNFSSHNPKTHRWHACFCGKSSTIRLSLPLHRPHRKILQLVKNPTRKLISTTAETTTSSDVLRLLDCLGFPVPDALYISLIKECTHFRDADGALLLHAHFIRSRRNQPRLTLLNLILIMFVSCGCIQNARQVFDEMTKRDFNTWAIMIAAYTDSGDYEEVIKLFINSQLRYLIDSSVRFPASWLLVCVLKACANTLNLKLGQQIHGGLLKSGYSDDLFVSSSLINFYGKIGCFDGGDLVFDQISCRRNVVVWTARINNNCKKERFHEVLDVFKEMGKEGIRKNSFTFSGVLSACSKISDDGNCGEQVHAHAIKSGLASKSYVQCGLVNMYGKFGLIKDAKRVFYMNGRMQNNACWNAMLSSFIQHGCHIEAIKFLYQMKAAGIQPQELWLNRLRSLCGSKVLEIK